MSDGPRRLRVAVATGVIAILAAACGSSTPSASPSATAAPPVSSPSAAPSASAPSGSPAAGSSATPDPNLGATYDLVESQVVAIRGLQPKKPVARAFIDEAQLRTMLTAEFDADSPPEYVAANERLYKALGLIPADADLRTSTLDLLSGGVAAFYKDDEGKLYVVSKAGGSDVIDRFYFAHEYDHALQDQRWTVFKDQHGILDQGDRMLARLAVYEGDSTLLMTQWAAADLDQSELLELVAASNDPEAVAAMNRAPAIMRESLVYPYTTGLGFVQGVYAEGGWAGVDALYDRMPESTEQILHPKKYAANEAPVKVTLPADLATRLGSGWTVPFQDTFGEFQLGVWLREGGVKRAAAADAAAGWGGDRLAVMDGPNGTWAVAMKTVWDTAADAAAFETAATTALAKAGGVAHVLPGEGGKIRWVVVGSDASTLSLVAGVLGLAG